MAGVGNDGFTNTSEGQNDHGIKTENDYSSDEDVKLGDFVRKNIKCKRCKVSNPDKRPKKEGCQCDAFGTIEFRGFGHTSVNAPYIRVSNECDTESICRILTKHWKMPKPKLIISVTGGAYSFHMKNRLYDSVKRGLINAATSTDAWIITGGTRTGVMKLVGIAVRDHKIATGSDARSLIALGIATWGVINNNESLQKKGTEKGDLASYSFHDLEDEPSGMTPLDNHHTHFVLVDDGSSKEFGGEIDMRGKLEKHISRTKFPKDNPDTRANEEHVDIPVVCLVLEGGPNTLKTAATAIENGTPVVAIKGSGKAADFIVTALELKKNSGGDNDNKLGLLAEKVFVLDKESGKLKDIKTWIKKIVEKENLISVFDFDDDESTIQIDQAILGALIKTKKYDPQTQLKLALAWNRPDVARKEIFRTDLRHNWKSEDLNNALFTALVEDKCDFVKLFFDLEVSLEDCLMTRGKDILVAKGEERKHGGEKEQLFQGLQDLYQKVFEKKPAESGVDLLETQMEKKKYELAEVGRVIKKLLRGKFSNLYREPKRPNSRSDDDDEDDKGIEMDENSGCPISNANKIDKYFPERDLFVWAVLFNRKELAELFWKHGNDHIGSALIGGALLKSLAEEADKKEELTLKTDLLAQSQMFEDYACGVLNAVYSKDKTMAHRLLVREQKQWGNTTALRIADVAEHMEFMAQPCTQTKLNKIWTGDMALHTQTWKKMLNMILPCFLFLIEMEKEKDNKDNSNNCKSKCSWLKTWFGKMHDFHTAPVTKFMYHTLAHLVFLALFSFFVLTDLHPLIDGNKISICEYIVWGWTATLFFEEIRQISSGDTTASYKIRGYFANDWNRFDLAIYFMFLMSLILRCALKTEDTFTWARIFYALTLAMVFLRFMHVFYIERHIGPKLIMINKMLTDLVFFLCFFLVFLFAYGVASQALRYPNAPAKWDVLKDVIYLPYQGDVGDCSSNRTEWINDPNIKRCPEESGLALILLALYMIMTNVLLLNLLIAMFSHTFGKVQEKTKEVWRYYRHGIILEYFDKPTLAPPLIIFSHIFIAIKCLSKLCKKDTKQSNAFKYIPKDEDENDELSTFERQCMEKKQRERRREFRDRTDAKVTSAHERIEKVLVSLGQMKESHEELRREIRSLRRGQLDTDC